MDNRRRSSKSSGCGTPCVGELWHMRRAASSMATTFGSKHASNASNGQLFWNAPPLLWRDHPLSPRNLRLIRTDQPPDSVQSSRDFRNERQQPAWTTKLFKTQLFHQTKNPRILPLSFERRSLSFLPLTSIDSEFIAPNPPITSASSWSNRPVELSRSTKRHVGRQFPGWLTS